MRKMVRYRVVLEPAEEGGYTAYAPSLPGCVSEGDTYREALDNIREAIRGWLEVAQEFDDEIEAGNALLGAVEVEAPNSALEDP